MEETNGKILVGNLEIRGLRIDPETQTDNRGLPICYAIGENCDLNARRLVAAWNFCLGIPTEEVEKASVNSDIWKRAWMADRQNVALREQNARLLAAVCEMEKMLPVLERVERMESGFIWDKAVESDTDLNTYRQALQTALAKRSNP